MKDRAIIINTARASLIDCSALYDALKQRIIAGAGFDVYEMEPLPNDHPLLNLDNVILTPHSAWKTVETMERFFEMACQNLSQGCGTCQLKKLFISTVIGYFRRF